MRYLSALMLAGLVALSTATATAESDPPTNDAAAPGQVKELDARIEALSARLDALGDVSGEIAALRAEITALRAAIAELRGSPARPTETVRRQDAASPKKSAAAASATKPSGAKAAPAIEPTKPVEIPVRRTARGKPSDVPRTENEKAVLDAVAPLLAYDRPGPDVIACGKPWFCVADLVTNPQYKDQPRVLGSIEAADRAWRGAGGPADGGIALMPGVHFAKNLGKENFFRNARWLRAQDKTKETVLDCKGGWSRSDFCLFNAGNFVLTLEGFEVRNAYCKNRCAAIGANSDVDSRLVMIDMTVRASDNGVRTTGRSVAMFRTRLIGNARSNVAHGAYISNDNRRGVHCPAVVAVDVLSTGNEVAHAFKTRCKVVYISGGLYEGQFGFAIDNAQGGRMLVEDAEIVQKKPSKQWVVIAHGLDKLVRDTGFAAGKNIRRQHRVTNVWRGQSTLRDVVITNELSPGFAGIWNNSKYRLPEKNPDGSYKEDGDGFVYDPASEVFTALPVELINVTVDGQPANDKDVVGPAVVVAP